MENNDMKIPTLDSLSRPERQFADAQSIAIGILLIMRHQVAMYGKCFSGPQTRGLTPPIYGFGAGGQNMGGVGSAPWRPGMIGNGVI